MRVVLTGASGQLGAYLLPCLRKAGHEVFAWCGPTTRGLLPIDLTDRDGTWNALDLSQPEVVIHAAAMSTAEGVRKNPELARVINVEGTRTIAEWCREHSARFIFTSTDLVFDGTQAPYGEDDPPHPLLEYGQTKVEAEKVVERVSNHLVTRVSLLFGPNKCGRSNVFDKAIEAIKLGHTRKFFENEFRTPLHYQSAAEILTLLVDHNATGRLHVAGAERVSRYELMRRAAVSLGFDGRLVEANRWIASEYPEPRPADVSLDTHKLAAALPNFRRPRIEESLTGGNQLTGEHAPAR